MENNRNRIIISAIVFLVLVVGLIVVYSLATPKIIVSVNGGDRETVAATLTTEKAEKFGDETKFNKSTAQKIRLGFGRYSLKINDGELVKVVMVEGKPFSTTNLTVELEPLRTDRKLMEGVDNYSCVLDDQPLPIRYSCGSSTLELVRHETTFGGAVEYSPNSVPENNLVYDTAPYRNGFLLLSSDDASVSLQYITKSNAKNITLPKKTAQTITSRGYGNIVRSASDDSFIVESNGFAIHYSDHESRGSKPIDLNKNSTKPSLLSINDGRILSYFGDVGVIVDEEEDRSDVSESFMTITDIKNNSDVSLGYPLESFPEEVLITKDSELAISTNSAYFVYEVNGEKLENKFTLPTGLSALHSKNGSIYGYAGRSLYQYKTKENEAQKIYSSDMKISNIVFANKKLIATGFITGQNGIQKMYGIEILSSPMNGVPVANLISGKVAEEAGVTVSDVQNKTIYGTLKLKTLRYNSGQLAYDDSEYEQEKSNFINALKNANVDTTKYNFKFNLVTRFD